MRPELLSPAGSPEALRAAVQNGADAVYLGWGDFNARQSAKNFSDDAFADALFDNQPDETPAFAEDREALARQEQEREEAQRQELLEQEALEAADEPEMHREEPLTEESLLSDIDAMLEEQPEEKEEELGDILFVVVNLARWNKIDAEQALLKANKKFVKRFRSMEEAARKNLEHLTLEEWDELWKLAKNKTKNP